MPNDPAATLEAIKERAKEAAAFDVDVLSAFNGVSVGGVIAASAVDVPRLVAALEAVLEQADDLTRKSEALDAEAEYIAGEHPEAAAVAVLKRERSIAYDECARWFREAITRALNGDADA